MKVAITTGKGGVDDVVSQVFGRSQTVTVVDVDESSKSIRGTSVLQNPGANLGGGAGIETANFIVSQGVNAVISGNYGVNSSGILAQAGIRMYIGSGVVNNAIVDMLSGKLQQYQSTVQAPTGYPAGRGAGYGRGMGRGRGYGRGAGFGRGMGRGRGGW